jgi:NADP-dependent 3-hydroxy acid dehydrogenase YdfG
MESFEGKTVVITGASAGVGRATARAFAAEGARLGLVARSADGLEETRRDVEARGATACTRTTDVADAAAVESAADMFERELGPVDVWVNNAMTSVLSPLHQMTAEEFRRVTDVTYLGYVYGTMSALRRMLPRDEGAIVQVGSSLAYRGIPLQSAYCGAKHAIQGFSESVRAELLHDGCRVWISMVQLPAINTPQFTWMRNHMPRRPRPAGPVYQPEAAARAVLYAASHRQREVNVGVSTLITIAADRVAPGILDRYMARKGYDMQQSAEPEFIGRPENLFEPVPGAHVAHGPFDGEAKDPKLQTWLTSRIGRVTAAGAVVGALSLTALGRRNRRAA